MLSLFGYVGFWGIVCACISGCKSRFFVSSDCMLTEESREVEDGEMWGGCFEFSCKNAGLHAILLVKNYL